MAMANTQAGVLLFGGTHGEQSTDFLGDTWLFTEGDWEVLYRYDHNVTVPEPRAISAMATFGQGAVLFGGMSGSQ